MYNLRSHYCMFMFVCFVDLNELQPKLTISKFLKNLEEQLQIIFTGINVYGLCFLRFGLMLSYVLQVPNILLLSILLGHIPKFLVLDITINVTWILLLCKHLRINGLRFDFSRNWNATHYHQRKFGTITWC